MKELQLVSLSPFKAVEGHCVGPFKLNKAINISATHGRADVLKAINKLSGVQAQADDTNHIKSIKKKVMDYLKVEA